MVTLHRRDQQHVRAIAVESEPLVDILPQHARCERPEALTMFYLQIERLLNRWRAGISQNGAITEGARAKLHSALHPADRFLLCKSSRCSVDQFRFRKHAETRS